MRKTNIFVSILVSFLFISACVKNGSAPASPNLVDPVYSKGIIWKCANANTAFLSRYDQASVVYDNKMWIIGGANYNYNYSSFSYENDVWYSTNGADWTEATGNAGFSVANIVVFDSGTGSKMWAIGGNSILYSTDGILWTNATNNSGLPSRNYPSCVVHENKIWIIAGSTNDVWSSIDGITWKQVTANAGFSVRGQHTSVEYNGKMWVIGGYNGSNYYNDVWYSTDGVDWVEATANAAFAARYGHTSIVYDNKMWVIGGIGKNLYNDVWYSTDGINWIEETANAGFSPRYGHSSLVFNVETGLNIWVIGGYIKNTSTLNDVWFSQ